MKLIVPEPDIELYKEGFENNDLLNRAPFGKKLSELVEKIDDPIVIAVDGAWGSGKTFFLKCWVGEHLNDADHKARIVYFDAFRHDFLDDPLIALVGVIGDRFKETKDKPTQKALKLVKSVAPRLARAGLRAGVSAVTAGVVGNGDAIFDEFWKQQDGKRRAMDDFRKALQDLTAPVNGGCAPKKLVIVVDELDRCRPDYALSLLEIIKHFFSVANVHFILGVNMRELENSVRARYGHKVGAAQYLQKFITLQMPLPTETGERVPQNCALTYFDQMSAKMGLPKYLCKQVKLFLKLLKDPQHLTLRATQKILTDIALVPGEFKGKYRSYKILVAGLLVLRRLEPDLYEKAQSFTLTIGEVEAFFSGHIDAEGATADGVSEGLIFIFAYFLAPETITPEEAEKYSEILFPSGLDSPEETFRTYLRDYVEAFDLSPPNG